MNCLPLPAISLLTSPSAASTFAQNSSVKALAHVPRRAKYNEIWNEVKTAQ